MFPTAVALMTKESTFTEMSPVVVNGRRYLVGKEAEREGSSFDTRQSSFVASDRLARGPGSLPLAQRLLRGDVVLGIPPGMYSKDYSQKILERHKDVGHKDKGRALPDQRERQDHPPGRGHILLPRQEPP